MLTSVGVLDAAKFGSVLRCSAAGTPTLFLVSCSSAAGTRGPRGGRRSCRDRSTPMTDFAALYHAGSDRATFAAERDCALYAVFGVGYACAAVGAGVALARLCVTHPQR